MHLSTTPAARLNESIDNEFLFRHRFGFDANLSGRAEVIALKRQFQITDVEVISKRRSELLSIKRTVVRITPDRGVPMMGWFYLSIMGIYLLPNLLVITFVSTPLWNDILASFLWVLFGLLRSGSSAKLISTPSDFSSKLGIARYRKSIGLWTRLETHKAKPFQSDLTNLTQEMIILRISVLLETDPFFSPSYLDPSNISTISLITSNFSSVPTFFTGEAAV